MDFSKLRQFQLSADTDIKPFKCGENDLNVMTSFPYYVVRTKLVIKSVM